MYQQQNYGYYPQPQYISPRQATSMNLKGRPVSSIEEARAASIDFDGSIFYFPDIANNRIYTKQINMDGTATLNMYELKEMPLNPAMPIDNATFITREEFEQALNQLRMDLQPPKIQF